MPADLDQFGCQYSHTAVVGREGLIELGHVTAYARRLLNQVYLKPGSCQIQRCLDTADPSADNHDIAEVAPGKIFTQLLHVLFER
jgi:hypothetical protein